MSTPARLMRLTRFDGMPPLALADALRDLPGLAVLDSARPGRAARWSFVTADPRAVLTSPGAPGAVFAPARRELARLDSAPVPAFAGSGQTPFTGGLVGYLAYEFGRHLERMPRDDRPPGGLPVLRLALHDWVLAIDGRTGACWLAGRAVDGDGPLLERRLADIRERLEAAADRDEGEASGPTRPGSSPALSLAGRFRAGMDRASWTTRVEAVRDAIAAGELYQANIARRLAAPFSGDPWPVFRLLRSGEPAGFAAYLDLGPDAAANPRAICSASPEPFLAVDGAGRVRTDPIKGTRPRGATRAEDRALAAELLGSGKDLAENTMIVDVLRNDLGRVCRPGSVRVPRLWRLERTPSVQHLVSTVTGQLAPGLDAFDLLVASFPGGSITGAPKLRAMELIDALEPVGRGPYCGCALWLDAAGAMGSSILIRTFVADGRDLSLHVGGGITWRSDPLAEWEETRTKARGPLRAIGAIGGDEEVP